MTAATVPVSVLGPSPIGGPGRIETGNRKAFSDIKGEVSLAPMLPPEVALSDEGKNHLIQYLEDELTAAESERWDFVARLARLKEKYRTRFPETPKDWPIANASQITIPVIKTAVNTAASRVYQTLIAAEPLASYRTEDFSLQDVTFDLEEFVEAYSDMRLDMADVLDTWVTELTMLGTAILEVSTKLDRRINATYDDITGEYRKRSEDVYSGPIVYHVPLEDFWIRPIYKDPQTAPWCGKEVRLSWSEIKDMAISGELNPEEIDTIWKYGYTSLADGGRRPDEKMEEIEKFKPLEGQQFSLFELVVRWDVDGDGNDEELMIYYHRPSRTLLRRKFSGFRKRPWYAGRFIRIPHWFYGEGLAEMLEHLQEEISTIHNQRIDNSSIANLQVILVSRIIQGLRPGDRLWTGKIVKVNDVEKDVGTLRLGEIYPSTVASEQIARGYAAEVSSIGETATGQARPVSRTTATAQLALLEELNRRFDKTVRGCRKALNEVYWAVTELFIANGTAGLAEEWLGPVRGRRLEMFLSMPSNVVRRKVKVQVKATRSTVNREVEFQSQIAVFQLIVQLWGLIRQEAAQLSPQLIPVLSHEMVKSIIPVFRKVMQYADAPDPDQAISVLTVLERILPKPEDLGGMGEASRTDQVEQALQALVGEARGRSGFLDETESAEGIPRLGRTQRGAGQTNGRRAGVSPVGRRR